MAWHGIIPGAISADKFEDDLLRQNSLIHQGWRVFRWTDRELLQEPERVKEQLALFLESIPGLLSFDDFLPKQIGEVFELRQHQKDALASLEQMRANRKTIALLTHAQGAGKTVVAVSDARQLGGRTLFVAHRRELVMQAYDSLREHLARSDHRAIHGRRARLRRAQHRCLDSKHRRAPGRLSRRPLSSTSLLTRPIMRLRRPISGSSVTFGRSSCLALPRRQTARTANLSLRSSAIVRTA